MTTQEIVAKLWNLCNVLRDDGITYHQYVTEKGQGNRHGSGHSRNLPLGRAGRQKRH